MDGIWLHKAAGGMSFMFHHNDIEKCELMLERATKLVSQSGGGILLVTEGVFGMAATLANWMKLLH